jgi:hypothetical protein
MKTATMKKVKADYILGMPATIWSRIFCPPVCNPKIKTLQCTELYNYLLFYMSKKLGLSHLLINITITHVTFYFYSCKTYNDGRNSD